MRLKPLQLLGRPIKRDPHLIGLPNKSNGLSASRGDLGGRSAHRPQTGAPGPLKPLQPLGKPIKGEPHLVGLSNKCNGLSGAEGDLSPPPTL